MDLREELKAIDEFFDSISDEEFSEMMIDCGAERILSTESIIKEQQMHLFNPYLPGLGDKENAMFSAYTNYNDDINRDEAA